MNSFSDLAGSDGCTTNTSGPDASSDTGVRSRAWSYGRLAYKAGFDAYPAGTKRIVCPSAGAFATNAVPIVPFAPARFSTTTGCRNDSVSFWPMARPRTSVPPPGGYGEMMRIGPDG